MHGFLEALDGVDFARKVKMGIRDNRYDAMVPTGRRAVAPHGPRACRARRGSPRAHTTRQLKFTLPGPMTIVDTLADAHYGDRVDDGDGLRRAAERGGARAGGGTAST